jgi:hypothetical protein
MVRGSRFMVRGSRFMVRGSGFRSTLNVDRNIEPGTPGTSNPEHRTRNTRNIEPGTPNRNPEPEPEHEPGTWNPEHGTVFYSAAS